MILAQTSLPKMTPAAGGNGEEAGGFFFCPCEEAVERVLPRFAGKILLVCDGRAMPRFAQFSRLARVVSAVAEEDALSLFGMPDGVGAVVAAGGEKTLRSARFFAQVRRIPCAIFPAEGSLCGAFEREGEIRLCGKTERGKLAEAEVYLDLQMLAPTAAESFAALLLSRLALVEERALRIFAGAEKSVHYDKAYSVLEPLSELTLREIVRRNAEMRLIEREGLPVGEGRILAGLHRAAGDAYPVWSAFCELAALYAAFFACGKPRRYFVPDYAKRAQRAGTPYWRTAVPSREEYAARALALERMRAPLGAETDAVLCRKSNWVRTFRALSDGASPEIGTETLRVLPEHAPFGLTAVIRDFGLMEF